MITFFRACGSFMMLLFLGWIFLNRGQDLNIEGDFVILFPLFLVGLACITLPDDFKFTFSTLMGLVLLFGSIYLLVNGFGYDLIEKKQVHSEPFKAIAGFILYGISGFMLGLEFNSVDDDYHH